MIESILFFIIGLVCGCVVAEKYIYFRLEKIIKDEMEKCKRADNE